MPSHLDPLLRGPSPAAQALRHQLPRLAASPAPLLISGACPLARSLAARAIHDASPRRGPLLVLEPGRDDADLALLLRGARDLPFTNADTRRRGWLETPGATILIPRLDELRPDEQARLLALISRPSPRRPETPAPRWLAATPCEPTQLPELGLRPDLLHRLDALRWTLPRLEDRRLDLPAIAEAILGPRRLTPSALTALAQAPWPGGLQQLASTLRGAAIHAGDAPIDAAAIAAARPPEPHPRLAERYAALLREAHARHRRFLQRALAEHRGQLSAAARALGLSRHQLRRRLQEPCPTSPTRTA